jgi:hypothetical protein
MLGQQDKNFELYKPVIVAYSDDLDDEKKNNAKNHGFDLVQAAPLTATIFDEQIFPLILLRQSRC